jgi:hypothetical protein
MKLLPRRFFYSTVWRKCASGGPRRGRSRGGTARRPAAPISGTCTRTELVSNRVGAVVSVCVLGAAPSAPPSVLVFHKFESNLLSQTSSHPACPTIRPPFKQLLHKKRRTQRSTFRQFRSIHHHIFKPLCFKQLVF